MISIRIMTYIWQSAHWPNFTHDPAIIAPHLAAAMRALGEVAGLRAGMNADDLEELNRRQIVQEALSSFEIEGVTLDAAEIEASVIASLKHRDKAAFGRRSDAIVELMLAARDAQGPLTARMLCDWHRLLFHGIEIEDLGRWRSFDIEIVRSAAAGHADVLYKGPPAGDVAEQMDVFLDWLGQDTQLPVPVRAAIGHLWFESIHPFSDGNGRIGRALIEHAFGCEQPLPFTLSRQIERDKRGYYAALQAARIEGRGGIDATAFVVWFLDALTAAADAGRAEALFLVRRNHFFAKRADVLNARQRKALEAIFAQGLERVAQGLSAKSYRKITGAAPATATRDLAALEGARVLRRSQAGGRSTQYEVLY
jgi:Fic family protein